MRRAVFLDRDGVLNQLVLNPANGEYESPHHPQDLRILPGVAAAAKAMQAAGFLLFIVSNQPSYTKGKASLEHIKLIAANLEAALRQEGVSITHAFYCYHYPGGLVPEYSVNCACRKPQPGMLLEARTRFALDLENSWLIGDQDTDIECGQRAGCKTVLIENPLSASRRTGRAQPTLRAADLADAASRILAFANV